VSGYNLSSLPTNYRENSIIGSAPILSVGDLRVIVSSSLTFPNNLSEMMSTTDETDFSLLILSRTWN
jgi:hypothetical protein